MTQLPQTSRPGRPLRFATLLLVAALAACAGDGSLIAPVPPAEAPRVTGAGRNDDREHARLVAAFGGEVRGSQNARAMLSEIAARLVPATERPDEGYRVTILDSPVVNAFALPNGRLYVTRGLLALANDSAEIAAVLAHEIAHVTLRHASARTELELKSALVSRVVADLLNDPAAGALVKDQSRFTLASFSRGQELEADQIGVKTLARSGFDPYGAARFLTSLGRASASRGTKGVASPAEMLSTHPSTPERVEQALVAARRIGAPGLGEADRAGYLAAIDGLAYGEDPGDGVVRGRRFLHPRLGVAFEAPEGLPLENTQRAVVGASADGSRRLLFDAIDPGDSASLEALLRATWSDALEVEAVSATPTGLPAAVATSRGKDWSFRLAAVRVGAGIYRLVFAAKRLDAEAERAFQAALASIRALPPEEARQLRPLRLQVVTAGEGDTAAGLGQRMAGGPDGALDRFLALNGLDRPGSLRAGERYKLLVE